MSDIYLIKEESEHPKFLKRKILRKKRTVFKKTEKELNIRNFKSRFIKDAMEECLNGNNNDRINSVNNSEHIFSEFEIQQKVYTQNGITHNMYNFINRLVINNSSIPENVKCKFNLQNIFIKVAKAALLNEIELLNFAIYLDKVKWKTDMELEQYLLMIALAVKKNLNDDIGIIDYYSRKEPEVIKKLADFSETIKKLNLNNITQKEINEKYKEFSKSSSNYCKINFVDYNFIVDKILKMSLPYSEAKAHLGNNKEVKEEVNSQIKYGGQIPYWAYHPNPYQMCPPQMAYQYPFQPIYMNPMPPLIPPINTHPVNTVNNVNPVNKNPNILYEKYKTEQQRQQPITPTPQNPYYINPFQVNYPNALPIQTVTNPQPTTYPNYIPLVPNSCPNPMQPNNLQAMPSYLTHSINPQMCYPQSSVTMCRVMPEMPQENNFSLGISSLQMNSALNKMNSNPINNLNMNSSFHNSLRHSSSGNDNILSKTNSKEEESLNNFPQLNAHMIKEGNNEMKDSLLFKENSFLPQNNSDFFQNYFYNNSFYKQFSNNEDTPGNNLNNNNKNS